MVPVPDKVVQQVNTKLGCHRAMCMYRKSVQLYYPTMLFTQVNSVQLYYKTMLFTQVKSATIVNSFLVCMQIHSCFTILPFNVSVNTRIKSSL